MSWYGTASTHVAATRRMTFASTLAISAYTRICNAIKLLLESPPRSLAARDRAADTLGDRDHEEQQDARHQQVAEIARHP